MTAVLSLRFSADPPDLLRARAVAHGFDPHLHDTFSVIAVLNGSASLRSKRWSRTVEAGDIFFFNPFEVHMGGNSQHPVEYIALYPSQRFVTDCSRRIGGQAHAPVIRTDILGRCQASEAFIDALSSASPAAAIEAALQQVLQHCSIDPVGLATRDATHVHAACQVIETEYMSELRTDGLARRVGVHKSHLVRTFHRVTGVAPQTYLRQFRVAKARELICAGATLSEAAYTVGFCDQAHLNREFKKVHGVPPGRLRRDLRAGSP